MASLTATILLVFFLTLTRVPFSKSSLTLVVDTTDSMRDELEVIKNHIVSVLGVLRNDGAAPVGNFILVPFNHPNVLRPTVTTNPDDFTRAINRLQASGGHQEICTENSLAGIEKALEISEPRSQIYVFTDAYARDTSNAERIWNLCTRTRSQVTVFLSGSCVRVGRDPGGDVSVFSDIAATCSGILFRFDSFNLRQAFSFMKRMMGEDVTQMTIERTRDSNTEIALTIRPYTSSVMIVAVGDNPTLDIVPTEGVERIVHTNHASVIRIASLKSREYQITNKGSTALTTYTKKYFPFQYGFSTVSPSILEETSRRPMPGRPNYFLIAVPENQDLALSNIVVSTENSMNDAKKLVLEQTANSRVYLAKAHYYPQTPFKITVYGENRNTFEQINLTTSLIEDQKNVQNPQWMAPNVQMLFRQIIVNFRSNTLLLCKVHGYPSPTISWTGGNELRAETNLLEIPSVHISRLTLENVEVNSTYECHAKNALGEQSGSVDVFVHREFVFEILQKPEDKQIEYGTEGKIYCEANAYPEASIKWSHNDTSVNFNDNIAIITEENALKIKNMSVSDVGSYSCEISNSEKSEKYSATITISGVDPPQIDRNTTSQVNLKSGVNSNMECRVVKGKPTPKLSWKFLPKGGSHFTDVPTDVYVKDGTVQFTDAKMEDRGVYRCEASNAVGFDYWDFTATVLYAPIIKASAEEVTVREGELVEIPCEVEADPPARVHWEMNQHDVMQTLDERHTEDEMHTQRFKASWRDSGDYHCIAENEVGKSEKTVRVTVLVPIYIQPERGTITTRHGSTVTLNCHVQYGNPAPSTLWQFDGLTNSKTVDLKRGGTSNVLQLSNVTFADQGNYTCIASNKVSKDSITISLVLETY